MGGMSGSKSANRKMSKEEKDLLAHATAVSKKEEERIDKLRDISIASQGRVGELLGMRDYTDEYGQHVGYGNTERIDAYLNSGQGRDDYLKNFRKRVPYQYQAPVKPTEVAPASDPGILEDIDTYYLNRTGETLKKTGKGRQQQIGHYEKEVKPQWQARKDAYDAWVKYQADKAAYDQQMADWQKGRDAWYASEDSWTGAGQDEYEAAAQGETLRQVADLSGKGPQEDKFYGMLDTAIDQRNRNVDIENGLYDRIRDWGSQENIDTLNNLYGRFNKASKGNEAADPYLARQLSNEEVTLTNKLRKQFGKGYATSSGGSRSLREFASYRYEALAKAQNEAIQSSAAGIQGWYGGQGAAIGNLNSYQQNQTQNVRSYLDMYNEYKTARLAQQQTAIQNYFGMGQNIQARQEKNASNWLGNQQMPYSNLTSYSSAIQGFGQTAQNYTNAQTAGTTVGSGGLSALVGDGQGGAMAGAAIGAIAAVAASSDVRLKTAIKWIGKLFEGIGLYSFRYVWDISSTVRVGVMAQEVLVKRPECVVMDDRGYLAVNYSLLLGME